MTTRRIILSILVTAVLGVEAAPAAATHIDASFPAPCSFANYPRPQTPSHNGQVWTELMTSSAVFAFDNLAGVAGTWVPVGTRIPYETFHPPGHAACPNPIAAQAPGTYKIQVFKETETETGYCGKPATPASCSWTGGSDTTTTSESLDTVPCAGYKGPPIPVCGRLQVKLSTPGPVTRGGSVTIKATTPGRVKAKNFVFHFLPTAGCTVGKLKQMSKEQSSGTLHVALLCSLDVWVDAEADNGDSAPAGPVRANVKPRVQGFRFAGHDFGVTPCPAGYQDRDFSQPQFGSPTIFGENFGGPNTPFDRSDASGILVPYSLFSWYRKGYEVATVRDPGGPFDGFAYVSSTSLSVNRVPCVNPYLRPDASPPAAGQPNWYQYNKANGIDVDRILAAILAHEGTGTATTTGHIKAVFDLIKSNRCGVSNDQTCDGKKALEPVIGQSTSDVRASADKLLQDINVALAKVGNDSASEEEGTIDSKLATSYTSQYYVWAPANSDTGGYCDAPCWVPLSPYDF